MNKYLLIGNKFMSEMFLKQPRFTCSVFGPFIKIKREFKKLCKQEI